MAARKAVIKDSEPAIKYIAITLRDGAENLGYCGAAATAAGAYNRLTRGYSHTKPQDVVLYEVKRLGKAKINIEWEE